MLAVAQRLRRRSEFAAAVRTGRRGGRGAVVVHLLPASLPASDDASATARAGFVIPRTVGSAVARNVVRRRLRHLMRDRLPQLPAATDVVVRALPGAAERSFQQLGAELDAAISAATRPARPRRRAATTPEAAR